MLCVYVFGTGLGRTMFKLFQVYKYTMIRIYSTTCIYKITSSLIAASISRYCQSSWTNNESHYRGKDYIIITSLLLHHCWLFRKVHKKWQPRCRSWHLQKEHYLAIFIHHYILLLLIIDSSLTGQRSNYSYTHLLSVYTFFRQLSRHLVGLWVTGNPVATNLLHRVLVSILLLCFTSRKCLCVFVATRFDAVSKV